MNATLRTLATAAICGILTTTTASAQKSGGSSSTGGGGGSASKRTTKSIPLLYSYYNGVAGLGSAVPTGLATLTFDATQTSRSLSVTITNVNLPDGTIIHFEMADNAFMIPTAYYPIYLPQSAGDVHLVGGTASLSIDTANGDAVPVIGTIGSVTVHAIDNFGNNRGTLGTASYHMVAGGGRP